MRQVSIQRARAILLPALSALAAATLAITGTLAAPLAAQAPTPEAHFGFRMGTDRRLAAADSIEKYFQLVAAQTDRVKIVDIGATTEGHHTVAAIVSSPENIRNLDAIRAVNQRLADPRTLAPDEGSRLAADHKVVLAIGGSVHASEVGATQAANELLYSLASSTDPAILNVLRNAIIILIPSLNPDGHRLVVDWYEREKGTPFEGGPMPWLYHKYAGHDINRDAFMMNMPESRNLARFFYTEWHPQVFLTMHQMETNGPRFFVPPNDDPIDQNYDPLIWRTAALLGSAMAFELQRDHHTGVLSNGMYDYYWPGYEDSAPLGHNTVCLLTEVAGVKVATPVTVDAADLRAGQNGLPEYKPQINFPEPWPGGAWTLRDIVDYDLSAVRGLLYAVAAYREQIVQNFYDMGRRAVERGKGGGPFAFIIPPEQLDPQATAKLEAVLLQSGIEIHRALEPFRADGDPYPASTDIILLAQPYRAYVKTLLERQVYPARRRSPDSPPERPYDVTGWTLPLQMGIDVREIERTFQPPAMSRLPGAAIAPATVWGERKPGFYVIDARGNGGALAANRLIAAGGTVSWMTHPFDAGGFRYAAGSLIAPYSSAVETIVARIAAELGLRADGMKGKPPADARSIGRARVALYKPWDENIDEGWTRWLLEQYEFPFGSITDGDVRAGNLRAKYDAIILPSATSEHLITGNPSGAVPPEYVGGLSQDGVDALKTFVRAGGTLICLDQAGSLAIEAFALPIQDVARIEDSKFYCPGSILRVELDPSQPLAFGMNPHTAGFFAFSSAYDPAAPSRPTDGHGDDSPPGSVQTIARYGNKDLLLSGWLEGEDVIAGRSAVVQAAVGMGHVVLLGFPVQHRAQSYATFRLLFNAILTAR
jgi:Zinc carboxypeptidase